MEEIVNLLAEQASSNLPAQVEALSRAQREHAAATLTMQGTLAQLTADIEKGRERNKLQLNQKNKLITLMCVKESERDERKLMVETLDKELSKALRDIEFFKLQIKRNEEEAAMMSKTLRVNAEKMDAYKNSVHDFEKHLPGMMEFDRAQEKVKDLCKERDALNQEMGSLFGWCDVPYEDAVADMKSDILTLQSDIDKKMMALDTAKCELCDRQRERQRLETTKMVQRKRNAALLIRLKRQVESQRQKYDQLIGHVNKTAERLDSTKSRLRSCVGN